MLKKSAILILFFGLILTGCDDDEPTTQIPTVLLLSSSSSITVGESTSITIELTDLETSVFGVSMLISYDDKSVVEIDTSNGFLQGGYFGINAISLFEIVRDTVHFSISAIGDYEGGGTSKLCDFEITGLAIGRSTFAIIPEEIYFINDTGGEVVITNLEFENLTITISE